MDSNKLQKFALVAEVVAGIAIVVTIAFLAFEMRSNTNAVRAQTFQSLMQQINDYRMSLVHPARVLANEKRRQSGWNSLSRVEKQELRIPALVNWGIYESAFFANERGLLGEAEWNRFQIAICRRREHHDDMWSPEGFTSMNELLTSDFVGYIQTSCPR